MFAFALSSWAPPLALGPDGCCTGRVAPERKECNACKTYVQPMDRLCTYLQRIKGKFLPRMPLSGRKAQTIFHEALSL